MAQPLYFEPDPTIQDSDLLGYGNLIFDNGQSQWLNGEPDIASQYSAPPANDPAQQLPQPAADIAPIAPIAPPSADMTGIQDPQTGALLSPGEPALNPIAPVAKVGQAFADTFKGVPPPGSAEATSSKMPLTQIPGTGYVIDPATGDITQGGNGAQAQGATPQQVMQPVPIPGTNHLVDPSTGNIIPGGAAQAGYGTGGLQLAQREGALPPDIAAQQSSQRETLNTNEMLALSTSRQAEADIYRQAALQRQGQLDAEKAAQETQLREQQAKLSRWQQEQRDTAQMDIKTDLVSADGAIGSVFAILGAAMLGAVGSDAGLRMIDSSINQNVNKQMSMRDSKLKVLADQIGSTEQAIAAGKAVLYKIAADKVETTQQLTKADVFEAQTPEILASLRQKQGLYEQEQQRISLGKTLEKAPVAAVPKPIDVEKYGKLAAEQAQQEKNIQRAANAIGLTGWDPKSGTFANRDDVLKNGIPGVGKADTFLQNIPGLKNLDTAATSIQGQKIRAALEGLVAAEAKAQNPGRAPTDADRDAARITLGLTTEQGTVAAIERLMGQQEQYKAQNAAAFGSAASTYENRIDAQGARPPQANGPVDTGIPLEPGKAREQLQRERMRPQTGLDAAVQEATGQQTSIDPIREVAGDVQAVAGRELPPEGLKILVAQAGHETADGKSAPNNNMFGHKARAGEQGADLMTTEGAGQSARKLKQKFAIYPTIEQSVEAQVSLLKRNYPDAWRALELGDAPAYVAALKDGGYFTGSETEYLNGIQRRL